MTFRIHLFLFLLLPLLAFASPAGYRIVETPVMEPGRLEFLADGGFDVWEVRDGVATLLVTPDEAARLEANGFVLTLIDEPDPHAKAVDGFYTFAEYEAIMQEWAAQYPAIVQLSSIGNSHEGRDLWLLKISDNVATDEPDEPEFLFIGLQHAREWLAGTTLHGITNHLITQYGTEPRVDAVVNGFQIYVLLVSNPDGYVYTHTTERLWRKNRRNNGNGTFGVDLNRNWPYKWDTASGSTGSNLYRGPSPLSEPENAALNDWILSRNGRVAGCLNYHAYGNLVMHSWAWTTATAPGAELMTPLVTNMATAMHAVHNQTYSAGSWGVALGYTGGGVTDDTFHATYGIPMITSEVRPRTIGEGGFEPPGTFIQPAFEEQLEGCFVYLEWTLAHATDPTPPVITNFRHTRINDSTVDLFWNTDDPATREVLLTPAGSTPVTIGADKLRATSHSLRLTGLVPGRLYTARAVSTNLAHGTTTSAPLSFRTTLQEGQVWIVE
ncbi:MAG: hypothetical protein PWP23_876 [Candidatus Sumerlaeota bacterium]|nr:hypothetical protein [Candidatus Sumerlaeota bacterium]